MSQRLLEGYIKGFKGFLKEEEREHWVKPMTTEGIDPINGGEWYEFHPALVFPSGEKIQDVVVVETKEDGRSWYRIFADEWSKSKAQEYPLSRSKANVSGNNRGTENLNTFFKRMGYNLKEKGYEPGVNKRYYGWNQEVGIWEMI